MLKTKQVGIYTVSQAGTLENVRGRVFHAKIQPLKKKAAEGEVLSEDDQIYNDWLEEWATLAACVKPLITLEQYQSEPLSTFADVINAVEEVNADEIEAAQEAMTPKQAKKKRERTTQKSISE